MLTLEREWVKEIPYEDLGLYVNYDFIFPTNKLRYMKRLGTYTKFEPST